MTLRSKRMLTIIMTAVALICPVLSHAYEYDPDETAKLMVQLIADIGGHEAIAKNSGKTLQCSHGGTKKITILQSKGETRYTGEYANCNQSGEIRDGIFEIVLKGDEILKSSSRRSKNGDLFDAAMDGNIRRVRELLKAKADVNYTESIPKEGGGTIDEWTPLMSAVARGNLEMVQTLVKAGAWVNYMNSLAVNALWMAANNGHVNIVTYLLKQGANVNNSNYENVTPLMAAAMNGHFNMVQVLVKSKADLDRSHLEGDTALMFAIGQGHGNIAKFLIDAGADVNIRSKSGVTALIIAAAEGNEEITTKLLDKNADTSAKTGNGKTALDVARAKGATSIIKLLEK